MSDSPVCTTLALPASSHLGPQCRAALVEAATLDLPLTIGENVFSLALNTCDVSCGFFIDALQHVEEMPFCIPSLLSFIWNGC